ncbi:MAG: M28 family peptidase [Bacillota bacterium]|nr:MAG: M28 family peptidase [Bacillota bacterium]
MRRPHAVWVQVLLFLLFAVVLSAVPALVGLLADKSGLGLSLFLAWYGIFPPVTLFLLGWLFYRYESNWLRFWGRVSLGVGIWFSLQALVTPLAEASLVFRLLSLPTVLAGDNWLWLWTVIFLGDGICLTVAGTYRLGAASLTRDVPTAASASEPASEPAPGRTRIRTAVTIAAIVLLAAVPALVVWSSVPGTPRLPTSTPGAEGDPASLGPRLPSTEEVWSYIVDIYSFGPRRTGSQAALATADYLASRLTGFGFADVRVETVDFDYWEASRWRVSVDDGSGSGPRDLECFYVPYSGPTAPEGVTAELVYVGTGRSEDWAGTDVAGKVVLVDLPPVEVAWDQLKIFGYLAYDKTGRTKGWSRPYPIGWMIHYLSVYPALEEAGVAGIIGVLRGYPDMGPLSYYAPYDGELRSVPSLYIREREGQRLVEALQGGAGVTASVVLEAAVAPGAGRAPVVYGVLPGRSETNLIIHSHYDSPWASGVEDSSGVGVVLALARYYAAVPAEARDRTLVFLFTGSHMVGAPTNPWFIESHREDIMARNLYDIAIEHVADDFPYDDEGLTARGAFVTENPVVASIFARTVTTRGLDRTLIFPTGTPLGVPTDAGPFQRAGYRVVSLISGPVYLFDAADTLDRVARDELGPMAAAYVDFIERLGQVPDFLLRPKVNLLAALYVLVLLTPLALAGYLSRGPGYAGRPVVMTTGTRKNGGELHGSIGG